MEGQKSIQDITATDSTFSSIPPVTPEPFSPTELQPQMETPAPSAPVLRVPKEVWDLIFPSFYPSQLARFSLVNKDFHGMVVSSRLWIEMFEKTSSNLCLGPVPDFGPKTKWYMLFLCAMSFQVCEQCFRVCDGSYCQARSAAMPLKVYFDWAQEEIKLCLQCRLGHFAEHPEPIPWPVQHGGQISEAIARRRYFLSEECVQLLKLCSSAYKNVTFLEEDVLTMARRLYGGDVGIKALPRSLSKPLMRSHYRVNVFYRRQNVILGGGTWLIWCRSFSKSADVK